MTPFTFVVLLLAAFRIWRLVGRDDITEPVRRIFTRNTDSYLHLLVTCSWCAGTWITLAVFAEHLYLGWVPFWLYLVGAAATGVGFIGELDARLMER